MFKFDLNENVAQFAVTFVYILSSAVGALVLGKNIKKNKYMYGAIMGLIYVGIIFLVSLRAFLKTALSALVSARYRTPCGSTP